jgi:hypothetical protein
MGSRKSMPETCIPVLADIGRKVTLVFRMRFPPDGSNAAASHRFFGFMGL